MNWWNWFRQVPTYPTYTSNGTGQSPGCCEVCGGHGMVCLNGQRFLCWDHYCVEMQAQRAAVQTTPPEGS